MQNPKATSFILIFQTVEKAHFILQNMLILLRFIAFRISAILKQIFPIENNNNYRENFITFINEYFRV